MRRECFRRQFFHLGANEGCRAMERRMSGSTEHGYFLVWSRLVAFTFTAAQQYTLYLWQHGDTRTIPRSCHIARQGQNANKSMSMDMALTTPVPKTQSEMTGLKCWCTMMGTNLFNIEVLDGCGDSSYVYDYVQV